MKGVKALVENCPSLEILDLSENKEIDDECVDIITSSLPRLKTLKLNRCSKITERTLEILYKNCTELKVRSFDWNLTCQRKIKSFLFFQNIFLRNCKLRFDPGDHLLYMSSLRKVVT